MLFLLLFYTGISLTLAAMFAGLAAVVGGSYELALFVGAIVFSISMMALYISAINEND